MVKLVVLTYKCIPAEAYQVWNAKKYGLLSVASSPISLADLICNSAASADNEVYTASGSVANEAFAAFYRLDDTTAHGARVSSVSAGVLAGQTQSDAEMHDIQTRKHLSTLLASTTGTSNVILHASFRGDTQLKAVKALLKAERPVPTLVIFEDFPTNTVICRCKRAKRDSKATLYPKEFINYIFKGEVAPSDREQPVCAIKAGKLGRKALLEFVYRMISTSPGVDEDTSVLVTWVHDGITTKRNFNFGANVEVAFAAIPVDPDYILEEHCLGSWASEYFSATKATVVPRALGGSQKKQPNRTRFPEYAGNRATRQQLVTAATTANKMRNLQARNMERAGIYAIRSQRKSDH